METARETRPRRRLPAIAVGAVGLWILAGALFKLFAGTTGDLPQVVRDLPLADGLTLRLAIAIELSLAGMALLRPGWAWPLLAGLLVAFDLVLVSQIAAGAENCGCFGAALPIPPWAMLAIDTTLLAGMLLARPWTARGGAPPLVLAFVLAVAWTLPWVFDREIDPARLGGPDTAVAERGGYVVLELPAMVGKPVWETDLAHFLDVASLPMDGLWVFYRTTCSHCAEHLEALADEETGERFLTLVRVAEKGDNEANRVVHRMPEGPFVVHAMLPDRIVYSFTTPAELLLRDGEVVDARADVSPQDHL
jgi:hypothetical protein